MSVHLPECEMASEVCAGNNGGSHRGSMFCLHCHRRCICGSLRAYERRVADEIWAAIREGAQYKSGFEGGLDAAWEAVLESVGPSADAFSVMVLGRALAAIDALREEQK